MFRKAAAGELPEDSGLNRLAALTDIDVHEVGVHEAAHFFQSKVCVTILYSFTCSFTA